MNESKELKAFDKEKPHNINFLIDRYLDDNKNS